jgi:hypothetical protein
LPFLEVEEGKGLVHAESTRHPRRRGLTARIDDNAAHPADRVRNYSRFAARRPLPLAQNRFLPSKRTSAAQGRPIPAGFARRAT